MMTILITGASGFVGTQLVSLLSDHNLVLRLGMSPAGESRVSAQYPQSVPFDLGSTGNDYGALLRDVDVVVHLAGIAHKHAVSVDEYRKVNVEGTARLAEAAALNGVKRFIFLSTVKIYGETSKFAAGVCQPFTEASSPAPDDSYSRCKLKAEQAVVAACSNNNMEYVILRPPLVYGAGVKANYLKLLKLVSRRIPLPFASIHNRRSFIYVENLCDIIRICIEHENARNQFFVVKDYDYSTTELIRHLAHTFGKRPWLLPCPPALFRLAGKLAGLGSSMDSLTQSLCVDDTLLRVVLNWNPPYDTETGFQKTVTWYRHSHARD